MVISNLLACLDTRAQATIAPSVSWQSEAPTSGGQIGPFASRILNGTLQLSPTRYVQVGMAGYYPTPTAPNMFYNAPHVLFFNQHGDTLTSRTYLEWAPEVNAFFFAGAAESDGSFLTAWYSQDSVGWFLEMFHLDSVGAPQWRKRYYTYNYIPTWGVPARVPDGYLLPLSLSEAQLRPNGTRGTYAGVTKFDLHGNQVWRIQREEFSWLGASQAFYNGTNIAACQDGSYAFIYQSVDRTPPPRSLVFDRDNRILRFTASGDTLGSAFFGEPDWQDAAFHTEPTPDGGFLVAGMRRNRYPTTSRARQGYVFKLDSSLHVQWEKRFTAPRNVDYGSDIVHAQQLANGHVRVIGTLDIGTTGQRFVGLVAEIVPPTGTGLPADTPVVVTEWRNLVGWAIDVLPAADGSAVLGGFSYPSSEPRYRAKWTGLGIPVPYDVCARPPRIDSAAAFVSGPGGVGANEYTFSLDVGMVHAGPRYGTVSLVTWDFGDGTPRDTGWVATHAYASPVPVRVRCTVYNNLGCTVTTDLFPLGPCPCPLTQPASLPLPAVSIFPNPATDGRFTIRGLAAGPTFTVTDALGQRLLTQSLDPATNEARLNLSSQPAGVYSLHLAWPDGRTLTRRLIR